MFHARNASPSKTKPTSQEQEYGLHHEAEPVHIFFLRVVRLMAISGVNDARAASMLFNQYGRNHRRLLILMRAMMLELARTSHRQIKLAPPCCGRITRDEAIILSALGRRDDEFAACHEDACVLLEREGALGAATCFQAVANCLADLGTPLN